VRGGKPAARPEVNEWAEKGEQVADEQETGDGISSRDRRKKGGGHAGEHKGL